MTKEIQYRLGNETIIVQVSTLSDFEECKEDMKSPLKYGKAVLNPDINPNNYEKIVIKCVIEEPHKLIVTKQNKQSGEAICHEVVEQFIEESWKGKKLIQTESIFCNHFELQYKYIII